MPWQLQPLIWPLIIATLALLAIPHRAHPQEVSEAVRAACDADVRTLCPAEYEAKDAAAIAACMRGHAPFVGREPFISNGCVKAWLKEHPPEPKRRNK
jgi:hypothetical protein